MVEGLRQHPGTGMLPEHLAVRGQLNFALPSSNCD